VVFDLDKSLPVLDELRRAGASVASDIKDMGGCDQVVLCLPDSGAVEALLGIGEPKSGSASPSHLGHVLQRDCLVIDCSTTTPDTSKKAAAHLEALGAGGRFIDAPVTGEKRRAEDGTLTIMVGGDRRDYNAALPVLQSMSQGEPVFMGCNGNGQIAKAMNNCLYNISCAAMAEILTLAAKSDLDTAALSKVVSGGSGQSVGQS
jgi:3-hydroxyisobutyrate dehydrogenase-like beta-hydroxyacid dehydrogenase